MSQPARKAALIERFSAKMEQTLLKSLGIAIIHMATDQVICRMPVDDRTRQPMGLLHGGASAALAETAASVGAWLNIDPESQAVVGIELNVNHLHAKREGIVTATATPIKAGRTIQVWEIKIVDEAGILICISRCTLAVIKAQ